MNPEPIELIPLDTLLDKVRAKREAGCRLVQVSATRLPDQVELTYSFDLNGRLDSLRLSLPGGAPRVPSISGIYGCAILYENEIHDLFNVQVDGMAVDFKGNLYKLAVRFPFGSAQAPRAPTGAAKAATPTQ
ncbi:MAG: NADH-quinone oxidoreductase subunit C [Verrucomicrobiota bacterium]|jgi:ech hydrogenase subunit D